MYGTTTSLLQWALGSFDTSPDQPLWTWIQLIDPLPHNHDALARLAKPSHEHAMLKANAKVQLYMSHALYKRHIHDDTLPSQK